MQELCLPLVDSLVSSYKGPSLTNVRIIGVQHILETTHAMFRSLYRLGLKPENVSIIGKCYSTCKEVYEEMIADGIDVSPGSFAYCSHTPFDEQFTAEIDKFLSSRRHDLNAYEQIIVLDDGGKCISALSKNPFNAPFTVAIEQTTSGYDAIRSQSLPFPVINVARSPLKLTLESPMIAQAAADRLYISLQQRDLRFSKALVIGGGAIGQAIRARLRQDMEVTIYDRNTKINEHRDKETSELVKEYSLILGCTGKTSVPKALHSNLKPGTVLVSVSSSDREFDAYHLRKSLPLQDCCLRDLHINDILLVRSGFPVNFDGHRENIEPELIQLTIALITAGILQARNMTVLEEKGIVSVNERLENKIRSEFLEIQNYNLFSRP